MERRTNKRGLIFLVIGLLLIFVAGGMYVYNILEDNNAGKSATDLLEKIEKQQTEQDNTEESPVVIVEGDAFCGTVIITKLGIELPVFDEWDYTRLKTAPCRYTGNIATGDIIIAAHNYKSHFGNLKQLQIGDEILFVDAYGTQHCFAVMEITTLDGTAVTDMKSGEWDFTLFTCTKGGEQRVTVRCQRDQAD